MSSLLTLIVCSYIVALTYTFRAMMMMIFDLDNLLSLTYFRTETTRNIAKPQVVFQFSFSSFSVVRFSNIVVWRRAISYIPLWSMQQQDIYFCHTFWATWREGVTQLLSFSPCVRNATLLLSVCLSGARQFTGTFSFHDIFNSPNKPKR